MIWLVCVKAIMEKPCNYMVAIKSRSKSTHFCWFSMGVLSFFDIVAKSEYCLCVGMTKLGRVVLLQ